MPGTRLRILDPETLADLPVGEIGEIFALPPGGPGSTYLYVGANARRTPDGWESVGDTGRFDADGYLYLVELTYEVEDAELRAHVAERVVHYKVPRSFERTKEPLRDDSGKVRRGALREQRLARMSDPRS